MARLSGGVDYAGGLGIAGGVKPASDAGLKAQLETFGNQVAALVTPLT